MAAHVYHWKHGWIPLDHTAALSKAKGNRATADRMMQAAHSPGAGIHSRQDVAKATLALQDIPNVSERHAALQQVTAAAHQHGAADLLPGSIPPHGYKIREDTISPAPGYTQATGRYSFTDPQGNDHYVGGSKLVASRRAHDHAKLAAQKEAERKAFVAKREAKAAVDAAERDRIRNIKVDYSAPPTVEENTLYQKTHALHNPGSERYLNEKDLHDIINGPPHIISSENKALAQKELDKRGYQEAKSRLAGQTDEQLRALLPRLDSTGLEPYQKAGARKYINERLGSRALSRTKT